MREDVRTKSLRYLCEGRLIIDTVNPSTVEATVRGNGAVYQVFHKGTGWHCDCDARTTCSHILAVQTVVVR